MAKKHSSSAATAYSHLSAVAYHYRINGKASITEHVNVSMYLKGLKRRGLKKPVKRATPMTTEILADLRKLVAPERAPNLVTWRTVWRIHVEFALMLRFDDVKR